MRPQVITVLGQPFTVEYLPKRVLDRDAVGHTSTSTQELHVLEGQGHHQERDTLLHEILHVASNVVGQDLKERQILALAPVLLDVLRRNPELVAYLTETV
jgi:hypothetical protein